MIFGIGCDIAKVSRFEKWAENPEFFKRFFNAGELASSSARIEKKCEHYASRFAAKEAFSKALGTGLSGFALTEVWVSNDEFGKPSLVVEGKARKLLESRCGSNSKIHVSISHEKEFAVAYVIIESL